ncbi:MAG: PIG-L deacetylase family protein [Gaiellaceae bacterium]
MSGEGFPPGRVVVLSPHLDDAVFSLGAAIASATVRGSAVTVLTVFAGDPDSEQPAGYWDARAGFRTAGEAARARRREDAHAVRLLGGSAEWLAFGDSQYRTPGDDARAREAVAERLRDAPVVLVPGFPLEHPDHAALARLLLAEPLPTRRIGLYVEQPYGMWSEASPRPPAGARGSWVSLRAGPVARARKVLACKAYRSQLPLLGPRLTLNLIRHELTRGECIAWLEGGSG